jgi:hypothetical protein
MVIVILVAKMALLFSEKCIKRAAAIAVFLLAS